MKIAHSPLVILACLCGIANVSAQESYELGPDSLPQDGVPTGSIEGPFEWKSKIYPGTVRDYWVYVPAQYDPARKACVLVVQDGRNRARGWRLTTVMDNLIHKQQMPVTIGIFINPGVVPAPNENAQARYNRSFEYDGLGDRYARFLLEEILPEVSKEYQLSDDPNDRAIAGASSGGICAFTVAWERPDAFRRVLSTIGTFVNLRGGHAYPSLVRKYEPKPIRVFLQDGRNDLDLYGGSWWIANQDMLAALQFSGYDVEHVWGTGGHNSENAAAIMPEALRWLWRDYPEPIRAGQAPQRRTDLVIPGEDWELVSDGHRFTEGPAVNAQGEVFFTDIPNNRIHRIDQEGNVHVFAENTAGANGLMLGPDGWLYACRNRAKQIVRYSPEGQMEIVVRDAPSNDLVVLPEGGGYYTDPDNHKVWHVAHDGQRTVVDEGLEFPNGVMTSADGTLLFVADTRDRFVYSYQVQSGGTLAYKQKYGYLHIPDDQPDSGADGMAVDTQGRLYVTTRMGLQVLDQLGRCHLILTKPDSGWLSNVTFGGPELDTLYVTCGPRVYRRRIQATGVIPSRGPVKPPKPGL